MLGNEVLVLGHGVEDLEVAVQALVECHDRRDVAAAVAVVGCGPHGDELLIEHELVTLLHELMSTRHQVEAVVLQEVTDDT